MDFWVMQKIWGSKTNFNINVLPGSWVRVFEYTDHVRISKYDWEKLQKEIARAKEVAPLVDADESVPADSFEMRSIY